MTTNVAPMTKCFVCGSLAEDNRPVEPFDWNGRKYPKHVDCVFSGSLGDPLSANYNVNAKPRPL